MINTTSPSATSLAESNYFFIVSDNLALSLRESLGYLSGYAAGFLQQIGYWLNRDNVGYIDPDGVKWIYNSYDEWLGKFSFLSVGQVGRIARTLERLGLLKSARSAELRRLDPDGFPTHFSKYDRTKFYTLCSPEQAETTQNPNLRSQTIEDFPPNNPTALSKSSSIQITTKSVPNNKPPQLKAEPDVCQTKDFAPEKISIQESSIPDVKIFTPQQVLVENKKVETSAVPVKNQVEVKTVTPPPPPPSSVNKISKDNVASAKPKETTEQKKLLDALEDAGVKVVGQMAKYLLEQSVAALKRALECLIDARKEGKEIRNPSGFIRKAIEQKWVPNSEVARKNESKHGKVIHSEEFLRWYSSIPKSEDGVWDVPLNELPGGATGSTMVYVSTKLYPALGSAPYSLLKWDFVRDNLL